MQYSYQTSGPFRYTALPHTHSHPTFTSSTAAHCPFWLRYFLVVDLGRSIYLHGKICICTYYCVTIMCMCVDWWLCLLMCTSFLWLCLLLCMNIMLLFIYRSIDCGLPTFLSTFDDDAPTYIFSHMCSILWPRLYLRPTEVKLVPPPQPPRLRPTQVPIIDISCHHRCFLLSYHEYFLLAHHRYFLLTHHRSGFMRTLHR